MGLGATEAIPIERFTDVKDEMIAAGAPRAQIARLSSLWASIGWVAPIIRHIIWRVRLMETGALSDVSSLASAR